MFTNFELKKEMYYSKSILKIMHLVKQQCVKVNVYALLILTEILTIYYRIDME